MREAKQLKANASDTTSVNERVRHSCSKWRKKNGDYWLYAKHVKTFVLLMK